MGFFSKYTPEEEKLLKTYSHLSKEILDKAIEMSKADGQYYLSENLGEIILKEKRGVDRDEVFAEKIRSYLEKNKTEGITEEDVKWWWNISAVERYILMLQDQINFLAFYNKFQEEGLSEDAIISTARKWVPIYGDPDNKGYAEQGLIGDDRKIPHELRYRINIYIMGEQSDNLEKFKLEIGKSSTFNALVRRKIRTGEI